MSIAEALTAYAEGHAPNVAAPERQGYAIAALDTFWVDRPCSDITSATCREYQDYRGKAVSTVRRELNTLQAALNFCVRDGLLEVAPTVTLPKSEDSLERWLTRQEAAWMLRAARSLQSDGRHLADFILHGLYTGSRKATILAMHFNEVSTFGGRVDTINGVLYRKPPGKVATRKRQGSARLPPRYLAHLRRQAANGRLYAVERKVVKRGIERRAMVADIRKGWAAAVRKAEIMAAEKGIDLDLKMQTPKGRKYITPHILKHTAITWALQKGASVWDVAGYFDTSPETIIKTYGHHSPDHQKSAVEAIDRRM